MSKNLAEKKQIVEDITQEFKGDNPSALVMNYSQISSNEINALRASLFEIGTKLKITKNTLIKRVFNKLGIELDTDLEGQNAILIPGEDFISSIKIIFKFIKDNKKGFVKFGLLEGALVDSSQVENLSKLPSRDVLIGQVVSGLSSPVRNFAFAVNDTQSKFIRVLNSIKGKKT